MRYYNRINKYGFTPFLITIIAITISVSTKAQENDSTNFKLNCNFSYLPDMSKAYLVTQEMDTIIVTHSEGSKVIFNGKVPKGGKALYILFDNYISQFPTEMIFADSGTINIEGQVGNNGNTIELYISKSKSNDDIRNFISSTKYKSSQLAQKTNELNELSLTQDKTRNFTELASVLQKEVDVAKDNYQNTIAPWFKNNTNSPAASYLLFNIIDIIDSTLAINIYNSFNSENKNNYYGQQIIESIKAASIRTKFKFGKLISNLPVEDSNGKVRYLYDIIQNNNLTLIDCWASWCAPCRAEIPNLKEAYNAYKNKGFNIIGISFDNSVPKWQKAILEDKTTWEHYKEIPNQSFRNTLGINSIPAYILVDKNGKLIAFESQQAKVNSFGNKIRGAELLQSIEDYLITLETGRL